MYAAHFLGHFHALLANPSFGWVLVALGSHLVAFGLGMFKTAGAKPRQAQRQPARIYRMRA